MRLLRSPAETRAALTSERRAGRRIGFVPTMGALHEGHLSHLRTARRDCDVVVMSIFVNPRQFGPHEDLARYPRDEQGDMRKAEAEGVDVVFAPGVDDMYPPGCTTTVSVGPLASVHEGAARPRHFDGVATVVAKLFNIVQPDVAYFGQKDAQQVAVVRRMVRDLDMPVDVRVGPTVREHDGLAMSSRNAYLDDEGRRRALTLYRALQEGRSLLLAGASAAEAGLRMKEVLDAAEGVEPEYAIAVDPDTFEEAGGGGDVLLAVAARVGGTRLIDNVVVEKS